MRFNYVSAKFHVALEDEVVRGLYAVLLIWKRVSTSG
jgi:hypothetical protein